jgi:hypothetical protein
VRTLYDRCHSCLPWAGHVALFAPCKTLSGFNPMSVTLDLDQDWGARFWVIPKHCACPFFLRLQDENSWIDTVFALHGENLFY